MRGSRTSGSSSETTCRRRSASSSATARGMASISPIWSKGLRRESPTRSRAPASSWDGTRSACTSATTSKGGIRHMVEEFQANNHDAGIALCPVAHPERFGVAELDAAGNVTGLVEKPKEPKSNLALVGIYLLRPSIFPIIDRLKPSWRNELEITD